MSREDLYLKPVSSLYPEDEWRKIRAQNVRQRGIKHYLETKVIKKDGSIIDVSLSISILRDNEGAITGSIGIMKDITERKRAEEELKKANEELLRNEQKLLDTVSQLEEAHSNLKVAHTELKTTQTQLIQVAKFESVGQLAAGVAHEVKNPLAILLQLVEYLSSEIPAEDSNGQVVLKDMTEVIERANSIVNALLDFSSVSQIEMNPENMDSVIEDTLILLKNQFDRYHVSLVKYYGENLPQVQIDRNRIQQALINLLLNGIHAMPNGGQLEIRTGVKEAKEGTMVYVEIEDNGPGIPDEFLDKIFDPFFTTKRGKGGTGMGLSIVRNILQIHGGEIEVRNRKKGGAVATVLLKV